MQNGRTIQLHGPEDRTFHLDSSQRGIIEIDAVEDIAMVEVETASIGSPTQINGSNDPKALHSDRFDVWVSRCRFNYELSQLSAPNLGGSRRIETFECFGINIHE